MNDTVAVVHVGASSSSSSWMRHPPTDQCILVVFTCHHDRRARAPRMSDLILIQFPPTHSCVTTLSHSHNTLSHLTHSCVTTLSGTHSFAQHSVSSHTQLCHNTLWHAQLRATHSDVTAVGKWPGPTTGNYPNLIHQRYEALPLAPAPAPASPKRTSARCHSTQYHATPCCHSTQCHSTRCSHSTQIPSI